MTSRDGAIATVVIPEFVVGRWWQHALHNQRALFMKRLLLFEPRVVVSSVPFPDPLAAPTGERPRTDPRGSPLERRR